MEDYYEYTDLGPASKTKLKLRLTLNPKMNPSSFSMAPVDGRCAPLGLGSGFAVDFGLRVNLRTGCTWRVG